MQRIEVRSNEVAILPGGTQSVLGAADRRVGPHTVVISGFIDRIWAKGFRNDDTVVTKELLVDITDVLWKPEFMQASTMTSWGEIYSGDSDEVDHSRWGIRRIRTGYHDVAVGMDVTRRIRLHLEIDVQGDDNKWVRIGYQIVANGTLFKPDVALAHIHELELIGPFPGGLGGVLWP